MVKEILHKLGLAASVTCVIHCLTFPLLIAFIPLFNVSFHLDHTLEFVLICSMVVLGGVSLYNAHKNQQNIKFPALLFISGVIMLITFHLFPLAHQSVLLILGQIFSGILIALSQWKLYLLNRQIGCSA